MRIALAACLLFLLAARAAPAATIHGTVGGEVEIFHETYPSGDLFEYLSDPDAYQQQYSTIVIESNDTRTSGVLELGLNAAATNLLLALGNEYAHGPQLLRDAFDAEVTWILAPRRRLRFTEALDLRRDVGGSLSYDQDLQHGAGLEFRADSLAGRWTLRARDEISNARVDGDSLGRAFDYDRNRLVFSLERKAKRGQWGGEAFLVHKEVPAGVSGGYREPGVSAFIRRRAGEAWYWEGEGESRRRDSFDSSFAGGGSWTHELRGVIGFDRASGFGLELAEEATIARYDTPDEVYMDYVQSRTEVRARRSWAEWLGSELAPAYEILDADAGQRYAQASAEAVISIDTPGGGWFHLSQEVGRRDYSGGADSTLSVSFGSLDIALESSDYLFMTSSIMGRFGLGAGIQFELFFDYTVERHENGDGNFSLLSCSTSLSRRF